MLLVLVVLVVLLVPLLMAPQVWLVIMQPCQRLLHPARKMLTQYHVQQHRLREQHHHLCLHYRRTPLLDQRVTVGVVSAVVSAVDTTPTVTR